MANVNDQTRQVFENAGVLKFVISATDYIVLAIVPGSLRMVPSMSRRIPQSDRGVPSVDLAGDLQVGEIEFQFWATKFVATGIYDRLMTADASGFAFQPTSLIVEVPTYRGASTGTRYTFTSPWVAEAPRFEAGGVGAEGDIWTARWRCATAPTVAAY